ncbi:hypothetical protein EYF80_045209 [Liparis tanakae]|uniref:Uncharacterized protein n=1 Tax=Liparis tanakae TaxID=230148 RepID=A0A4Z2FTI2_9TELE|nr:hypothetical protein EYF80_045209 [Liparis tanakae]
MTPHRLPTVDFLSRKARNKLHVRLPLTGAPRQHWDDQSSHFAENNNNNNNNSNNNNNNNNNNNIASRFS